MFKLFFRCRKGRQVQRRLPVEHVNGQFGRLLGPVALGQSIARGGHVLPLVLALENGRSDGQVERLTQF